MTRPWRLVPSLIVLRSEIKAAYPGGRSTVSDGSIGNAEHSARESDHNPDENGDVRAIDVTQDDALHTPNNPADDVAEALAEWLRASRDPRIKYVIWKDRIFRSYAKPGIPAWTWARYTGPNPHRHHCHISVKPGATGADGRPWGFHLPGPATPTDPNRGRPWRQFAAGATDTLIYRVKGGRNDEVAELQILLGNKVTGTYTAADVADVVALKKAARWMTDDGRERDRSSVITARFMDALRHLAGAP